MRVMFVLALLAGGPAWAQVPELGDRPRVKRPSFGFGAVSKDEPREFELGVGLVGSFGGSVLGDVPPENELVRQGLGRARLTYDGFSGVGGGGGLAVTGAWRGILGFELDVLYLLDRGVGDLNGYEVEMSQWSVHLPLLMKISAPTPYVRPALLLGIDVVVPVTTDASQPSELSTEIAADAGPYVQLAGGLSIEFMLPFSGLDLRIPLTFRMAWNPATDDYLDDRAELDLACSGSRCATTAVMLSSEWQYQLGGTLGLAWYIF